MVGAVLLGSFGKRAIKQFLIVNGAPNLTLPDLNRPYQKNRPYQRKVLFGNDFLTVRRRKFVSPTFFAYLYDCEWLGVPSEY